MSHFAILVIGNNIDQQLAHTKAFIALSKKQG